MITIHTWISCLVADPCIDPEPNKTRSLPWVTWLFQNLSCDLPGFVHFLSPKQSLRPLYYWSPFMYHNLSLTNRSFTIALGSKQYFIVAFEESSVTLISELTFHKRPYATFLTQPSGILSYSRMIASDLPIIAEGPLVVMWYLTFTDVS